MTWAQPYVAALRAGRTVTFRPRGNSMRPRIESGDLCTVEPVDQSTPLTAGEIVLCRVRGAHYLHLIKAVNGERYLIGNNRGGINGWIGRGSIFGRLANRSLPSIPVTSGRPGASSD